MIEIEGDLWQEARKYDAICITTNGYVKTNGEAVMGRGIALQAAKLYPELPRLLGRELRIWGNVPRLLSFTGQYAIFSFPVKHKWNESADLELIAKSCNLMMIEANKNRYINVLLPKPGCGNGGLNYEQVRPIIKKLLDDRFYIIDYPNNKNRDKK